MVHVQVSVNGAANGETAAANDAGAQLRIAA